MVNITNIKLSVTDIFLINDLMTFHKYFWYYVLGIHFKIVHYFWGIIFAIISIFVLCNPVTSGIILHTTTPSTLRTATLGLGHVMPKYL